MTDAPTPLQVLLSDRPLAERLLVAEAHDGRAHDQEQRRHAAAIDPPAVHDADGFARAQRDAEADLARWDDAVDAVRAEAGLPPHSGLPARLSGEQSENMDHLLDRHADGLRAVLADPDADERRLAAALALLVTRDAVTVDDLEPLLASPWRKRLLVKSTNAYSPGAPAVVSVIRLLRRGRPSRDGGGGIRRRPADPAGAGAAAGRVRPLGRGTAHGARQGRPPAARPPASARERMTP